MTQPRLLCVASLFPCWSETFIVREIATMIAAGADVRILSLKVPHEKLVQAEAERLMPRVQREPVRLIGPICCIAQPTERRSDVHATL